MFAMSDGDKKRLQRHRVALVNNLTVDEEFLSYFMEEGILREPGKQRIQIKQIDAERAGAFLDMLPKSGPHGFSVFIRALRETGQGPLADMLQDNSLSQPSQQGSATPVQPASLTPSSSTSSIGSSSRAQSNTLSSYSKYCLSHRDREKITKNKVALIQNMIVNKVLLAHLTEKDALTSHTEQEIMAKTVSSDRVAELLKYIEAGSHNAFKYLVLALMETRQEHLAKMLDESLVEKWSRVLNGQMTEMELLSEHAQQPALHIPPLSLQQPVHPSIQETPQSPIDETDLTQKDSIMSVEMRKIDDMNPEVQHLLQKSRQCQVVYRMLSKPRGRAVIININKFEGWDPDRERKGSEHDPTNLKKLFEGLYFDVKLYTCNMNNITAEGLKKIIQTEAADKFHDKADCLVLFILSHGGDGYVLGSDHKKVSIKQEIETPFNGQNCKQLKGKPKIFFINTCRVTAGDELVTGVESMSLQGPNTLAASVNNPKDTADVGDIFRAYSTVSGFESYRHPTLGCIFVRAIVEVFQAHAYKDSFYDLMIKVNQKLTAFASLHDAHHSVNKKLYFFPGHHEKR